MSRQKSTAKIPSKARGKISEIKRTGARPSTKAAKMAPVPKKKAVSTQQLLNEFYPDLTEDQVEAIANLPYLDPGATNYIGDLQEIAEAVTKDNDSTLILLSGAKSLDAIYWTLPSRHDDELIFEFNIAAEFEQIRGQIMAEPCKTCGGNEFHCINLGGSSDEIQRYRRICVACRQ